MEKRRSIQLTAEYIFDGTALALSTFVSYFVFGVVFDKILAYSTDNWVQYFVMLFISYSTICLTFAASINLTARSRSRELLSIFRNNSLTYMMFAVTLLLFKNPLIESRYLFIGSYAFFVVFSCVGRYILKRLLIHSFSSSSYATRVSIISVNDRAEEFVSSLKADWSKCITSVVLLDDYYINDTYSIKYSDLESGGNSTATRISANRLQTKEIDGIPVIANFDNFMDWLKISPVDEVFINLPSIPRDTFSSYIEEFQEMGIIVHINIPFLEKIVEGSKFDNIHCEMVSGQPMASFAAAMHDRVPLIFKRLMDIVGSFIGLVFSIPIILITAIPLLIESPGPLFFKQQRVGKNGRLFSIYKLRSMYADAEKRKKDLEKNNTMNGLMFKMEDDPRITKVGRIIRKLSIDELPQFWNVLRGDMSLVGTRPPTIDEFEQYESHHKRRLSLKPGITGMWQVSGRSDICDFEEVVRLDCEYIDDWSIILDIKIMFKTIYVVLFGKGAS